MLGSVLQVSSLASQKGDGVKIQTTNLIDPRTRIAYNLSSNLHALPWLLEIKTVLAKKHGEKVALLCNQL